MDLVTLYIATHNITGLKYFGKTTRYFVKEDLQNNYHGSGVRWNHHLNKHGDNVTMDVYVVFSLNETDNNFVEHVALKFSEENDIVNSKEWANINPENGLSGGVSMLGKKYSEETKLKIGSKSKIFNKCRKHSEETKLKIFISHTGFRHSEESKLKMSASTSKQIISDETKLKLSSLFTGENNPMFGLKHSEETKNKMSESRKNKPKIECPHCKKIGDPSNMKRWHFENCKAKIHEF